MAHSTKNSPKPEPRRPRTLPATPNPDASTDLRTLLDGKWADVRNMSRELLNDSFFLPDPTRTMAEAREDIIARLMRVRESDMPKGAFSEMNGGTNDNGSTLTGLEMIGHVNLAIMVKGGVQWGLWGGVVDALGTERHAELVKKIIDLEALGCFGMTELGHGSDVQNITTTATYDPETKQFDVHSPSPAAKKAYIGNAARHGQYCAVFAQLHTPSSKESHGVHCLVVPIRDENGDPLPGVTIGDHGHKGGLLGVDNGTISFDHVKVDREALLNRFGDVSEDGTYSSPIESRNRRFFTMLGTLIRGRIVVGGAAGSAAQSSLALAVRYANRRRQFEGLPGQEKTLMEHRSHRLRLLPLVARSYALKLLQNQVVERLDGQYLDMATGTYDPAHATKDQQVAQRELEARAAALKTASTAHATRAIQEAREACGGAGYMAENLLTTFKADSDVFTTFEGDNTVLIQMVGKELITAYAREMANLTPLEIAKYGADSVTDIFRRRTAIPVTVQSLIDAVSDRDETSLFDAGYQMKLFADREASLLKSLIGRVKAAKKQEPAEAVKTVDRAQDHLIAAAWARVDTLLLEALLDAESKLPEGSPAAPVLEQVRHLFALSTITAHAGWYLEQNVLGGARTKAARAAVNDLVDSLAPWSDVLVDAFGVPDIVFGVPMLHDEGVDQQLAD